ncbi:MAG: ABC transporter ATP-binding protein [Desulfobacteraceae bacterium]|nr:ABC transporter ATP-binding protein [Desulfobacteraceae bacterium]
MVDRLVTVFDTEAGRIRAVDGASFSLAKNAVLGIVGESGCGKSVTALSIMRLLPKPAGTIESGRIMLNNSDLVQLPVNQMHAIRGGRIGMIFQEPMTALNPVYTIGHQLMEVFELHRKDISSQNRWEAAAQLLHKVGIPESGKRMNEYPHLISGGMRQRVMIAMALAGEPELLIADEPTTALDVTIQAQILDLIMALQQQTGMGVMFITHALGVVAEMCHDVAVMYAGQIVESAPSGKLFAQPKHPYTQGLLTSIPQLSSKRKTMLPIIKGAVPSFLELPPGCRFQNRCPHTMDVCKTENPELKAVAQEQQVRCFLY